MNPVDWSKIKVSGAVAVLMATSVGAATWGLSRWIVGLDYATRADVRVSLGDLTPLLAEVKRDSGDLRTQVQNLAREVSELRGSLSRSSH